MKQFIILILISIVLFISGWCLIVKKCFENDPKLPIILDFNFFENNEEWIGDFAEYPIDEETHYELKFNSALLPVPLDTTIGALRQTGNNHSDDLFMFIKRKVTNLTPDRMYTITFIIEFASNVADNQVGVGGSPGEDVTIKAGAIQIEPVKHLNSNDFYLMNIDKGNQLQGGKDMMTIGDFSNDTGQNIYTLKTVRNKDPFQVKANGEGELWLIIGTDSGFESTTTIYYNKITVEIA